MLRECIEGLAIRQDGIYVDVTYGGGGHSKAILNELGIHGKLIAFDQDSDAIANKVNDSRITLIQDNFRMMKAHLEQLGITKVNGILADLGVSSHHFDEGKRGFSIRFEHDLDMRMDQRSGMTALELINTCTEKELVSIFSNYGEIKNSKMLAAAIIKSRNEKEILSSVDFRKSIGHLIPKHNETQYLAQVYQALRIAVNDEIATLRELLEQSNDVLAPGGRLVVMSYHSLEDRLVKNYIAKGNFEGEEQKDIYGNVLGKKFNAITRKPVTPSSEELIRNPRSRSAKLRVAEKI